MDSKLVYKIPIWGISLRFILSLFGEVEGTTLDSIRLLVLLLTYAKKCSLVDMLKDTEHFREEAEVFVSFLFQAKWKTTIKALGKHLKVEEKDTYVWMSIFVANQHLAKSITEHGRQQIYS